MVPKPAGVLNPSGLETSGPAPPFWQLARPGPLPARCWHTRGRSPEPECRTSNQSSMSRPTSSSAGASGSSSTSHDLTSVRVLSAVDRFGSVRRDAAMFPAGVLATRVESRSKVDADGCGVAGCGPVGPSVVRRFVSANRPVAIELPRDAAPAPNVCRVSLAGGAGLSAARTSGGSSGGSGGGSRLGRTDAAFSTGPRPWLRSGAEGAGAAWCCGVDTGGAISCARCSGGRGITRTSGWLTTEKVSMAVVATSGRDSDFSSISSMRRPNSW